MRTELNDSIKVLEIGYNIVRDSRDETRGGAWDLSQDMRDEVVDTGMGDDDRVESCTRTSFLAWDVSGLRK